MSEHPIQHGDPTRLAALLGDAGQPPQWGPEDLAAILAHQLRAPLLFDVHRLGATGGTAAEGTGATSDRSADAAARQIRSFGDLLTHPAPPRDLLMMTKTFAKTADAGAEGGAAPALPPEVASVLYFAAIAAARFRLGERITALDDRAVVSGLTWALRQPWLTTELRPLFTDTMAVLGPGSDHTGGDR